MSHISHLFSSHSHYASYSHPTYQSGYGIAHGSPLLHGIGHMILSSIIHGLIYATIFKALRGLSISEALTLTVMVIGGIVLFAWLTGRARSRPPY